MDPTPQLLGGLVAFSLGLGLFVFPRPVASAAADALGRPALAGHRATVAVRGTGGLGMALGLALLLT